MNNTQKLASIAEAMIRMEGMKAENQAMKFQGKEPKYRECNFLDLVTIYLHY